MNSFNDDRATPECVDCRAGGRFAGSLVSRRFPAALMVGVLALSSIAPSAAFAAEGDHDVEGGAIVDDVASNDAAGGDVDLGATADLGEDAGAAPVAEDAAPAAAPVAAAPERGAAAPVSAPEAPEVAAEPAAPVAEVPAVAPVPASEGAAAPATVAPAAAPEAGGPRAAQTHRRIKAVRRAARVKHRTVRVRVVASPAPAAVPPRTVSVPVQAKVPVAPRVTRISAAASRPATRGAKAHVVAPGESLWSIATDLLGAGASRARVSQEVEWLWEHNRARIGTGDRNLLRAGTTLQLS
jgi:hypothetical protein